MRRIKLVLSALLLSLLFTGCGDLQQLMDTAEGAIPKFKGGVPNLLSGTWMCKSTLYDGTFKYRLTLKSDGNFTFETTGQTIKGTYSFSYNHLDLLEASGSIVFSEVLPPDSQLKKTFSYEADEDNGPQTLILSGTPYSFVQR